MKDEISFPATRMRRLRQSAWARRLTAEARLGVEDLIWPLFLTEGSREEEISTMPNIRRLPIESAVEAARQAQKLKIPAIALFPNTPPEKRDPDGSEALNPDNLVCRTIRAIKKDVHDVGIICDVALDPYTSHGHDGLMKGEEIVNDATVEVLVEQALVQREAGCDVIAPSDMMDGRVKRIRKALEKGGHQNALIMSYAAKYASGFYGPFREAVGAKGILKGDKKTYQMNPANSDEALREVALDLREGADMVMVKPGLPFLDIVRRVKDVFQVPTFAYQVSGEYAMLQTAAASGAFSRDAIIMESLLSFKRAGADGILTYFAPDAARLLKQE